MLGRVNQAADGRLLRYGYEVPFPSVQVDGYTDADHPF